jgi:hypothetical protein
MYGGSDLGIDNKMRTNIDKIISSKMQRTVNDVAHITNQNRDRFKLLMPVMKIGFMIFFILILTPEIEKLVTFFDMSDVYSTIIIQWITVLLILWTFLPARKSIL